MLTSKTNLAILPKIIHTIAKNHPYNQHFCHVNIRCLRLGWQDVHQTQISVALESFGTAG